MGQSASQTSDLELWETTVAEIEEYERQEWAKITPGCCSLAVYWVQMCLCGCELIWRTCFHFLACLFNAPCYVLAELYLTQTGRWSKSLSAQENIDSILQRGGWQTQYHWPLLPFTQLEHHAIWLMMYINYFPPLIWYNLTNPCAPFYADGADVTIYRPAKPGAKEADDCCSCCQCCSCSCLDLCKCNCCDLMFTIGIRYFRSSFFALSGYHALQCGTCCGPCVRGLCYDPCVGADTQRGLCRMCEVDEIRIERWVREAHEAKVKRTHAFFNARPHLMRPGAEMGNVETGHPDPRIERILAQGVPSEPPEQHTMSASSPPSRIGK